MRDSTRGKSRSGKNRKNTGADTPDVAVDVAVRGKFTISGRKIAKKLKWAAIATGFVSCVLFVPRIDVEFIPRSTEPVVVHTLQK